MADTTTSTTSSSATTVDTNIFSNLVSPRDLTKYTLMRGVTDFANLEQYNLFETGYSFLTVVKIPKFLEELCAKSTEYKNLIDTYCHILEYEFRGLDGIDNITTDTNELTNGISNLQIITKVTKQAGSQFSMRFFEKHGSVLNRVHELFLTGLRDPRTQVKTYHGLIQDGVLDAGFENETFAFMYMVTDNTLMNLEKAFYIVAAQPTNAEYNMYNSEKGDIQFKEITTEFNGFPITGPKINAKAVDFLKSIREATTWRETEFNYTGVSTMTPRSAAISNSETVSLG